MNWLIRLSKRWSPTDLSLEAIKDLKNQGYTSVTWKSSGSCPYDTDPEAYARIIEGNAGKISGAVAPCGEWDGVNWNIDDFISETETQYSNWAIAGRTHPGDNNCELIVTGTGKQEITDPAEIERIMNDSPEGTYEILQEDNDKKPIKISIDIAKEPKSVNLAGFVKATTLE